MSRLREEPRRARRLPWLLLLVGGVALWAVLTVQPAPIYRGNSTQTLPSQGQAAPTPLPTTPVPLPTPTATSPLFPPVPLPVPTWDPEQLVRDGVVTPSANLFTGLDDWFNRESSLFSQTQGTATYANDTVLLLWRVMLTICNALLLLFLLLAGYECFFASLTLRYASILELLPRILLAFLGANVSLLFARLCIEANNLLCRILLAVSAQHPFPVFNLIALLGTPLSLPILLLFLTLCVLMVFLALEIIVREGILILLIIFLPWFFVLLASRRTARLGQLGLAAFVTASFLQFAQLTVITAGTLMLIPFVRLSFSSFGTGLAPVSTLLGALALFWITLQLPRFFGNWILLPIAESGRWLGYVSTYGVLRLLTI